MTKGDTLQKMAITDFGGRNKKINAGNFNLVNISEEESDEKGK